MQPLLPSALYRLNVDLEAIRVRWCLVGGFAVSARAEPRTTKDLDVVVSVADDAEAESVVVKLTNRGYRISQVLEHKDRDRLATARLLMPGEYDELIADLLFASTGIETEIAAAAEPYEVIPGVLVPLATVGHLLAMKVLALTKDNPQKRPQDFGDIRELLGVATTEDLLQARHALDLVSRRGYHQGKDLLADFEDQLHQFRQGQESRTL